MAERRMFAKTIIDSDAFLDMPMSAQLLYFHLSMRADDDGFLNNPKKIQRMIGASNDDLKLLIAKSFLITFETGVVVIKHWRIHNYIQNDRYKPTVYTEEKAMLRMKDNKAYSLVGDDKSMDTECIQDGYELETQVRIGKDRLGKDSLSNNKSNTNVLDCPTKSDVKYVFLKETELWNSLKQYGITPIRGIAPNSDRSRMLNARLQQYGENTFEEIVQAVKDSDFLQGKHTGKPWQIDFDWVIRPNNYPKVLEGKYKNGNNQNISDWGL